MRRFLGNVRDVKCMLKLAWKGSTVAPWKTELYPADPRELPDVPWSHAVGVCKSGGAIVFASH